MEIDYINGPRTDKVFGMSKYQMEIFKRIEGVEWNFIEYDSLLKIMENKYNSIFSSKSSDEEESLGMFHALDKTESFSQNKIFKGIIDRAWKTCMYIDTYRYRQTVKKSIKEDNVKHLTYQELAYLLKYVKMDKTIVTCHDIIPWAYDNDRSRLWKNIMTGLRNADRIITISEFSKNELVKYLNYPADRIHIVKDAVDHDVYYKNRDKGILRTLNLLNDESIVLYVGSETPRQNLPVLIKAFSKLKKKIPNIKLVKIGESQSYGARETLLKLINDLDLQEDVIFVGYVPEEYMPKWYNAADVLVYPCEYAGFGLPPLEAMACGTPVITSNTTSLPEVVGDAGIMIDPHDVDLMADKIYEILINNGLRDDLVKKGIERAKLFKWDDAAHKTRKIYDIF
ncbi:glycosyltransferase family 4 protein [Methanobacterium congolense]|uniref:Putative glycosyltransferase MJ1607 n=1 Tax=Methanobacterium congolense TaxID=118062 RepID=A0A1D3L2N7_9EURY|nr:glycosyltransferase family 1 protein [Methanobacterium congolense]SCG85779.1 putative glycosyltransferase MJ1607 [Methanobacterium congolense]